MSVLPYLIIVFLLGLCVGALARLLVPGPNPMGLDRTALVGIGGALCAGLFSWYVLHRHGWGIVIAVLFSMLVVWLYRRPRTAGYRDSPPAEDRPSGPAGYRAARTAGYRGRTPGDRRPPY